MVIAIGGTLPVTLQVRTRGGHIFTVPEGIDVIGSDRIHVGRLKEIGLSTMLVDRPRRRDVYVPFETIADVTGDAIVLTIPAAQVDGMHWLHPGLV